MTRPSCAVEGDKRAAGLHRLAKEGFEHLFLVAVAVRVLFPDERIARDGEQVGEVVLAQWPEFEKFALQTWLEFEWHSRVSEVRPTTSAVAEPVQPLLNR